MGRVKVTVSRVVQALFNGFRGQPSLPRLKNLPRPTSLVDWGVVPEIGHSETFSTVGMYFPVER